MDEITKQKNILDLKYQTNLNYLNIIIILIISSFITTILSIKENLNASLVISLSILIILLCFFIWLIFSYSLKKIRNEIKNL